MIALLRSSEKLNLFMKGKKSIIKKRKSKIMRTFRKKGQASRNKLTSPDELFIKQESFQKQEEMGHKLCPIMKKEENIANNTLHFTIKLEQFGSEGSLSEDIVPPNTRKASKKLPTSTIVKGSTSEKNIIKNYGRALQNFATSNMILPYSASLFEKENVLLKDFRGFVNSKRNQVRSIAGLRGLLLVEPDDDKTTSAFKRIFQALSIIFLKYFCVNWIFSGKLMNKMAHLKCRFKMLRRVKNPESFTYLKAFL